MPKTTSSKVTSSKKASKEVTSTKVKKLAKTNNSKSVQKTSTKKNTTTEKKEVSTIPEYYDLPNTYNKTMVKVLFQTPKKLFVYWEISANDKLNFLEKNGNDYFKNTSPFLIVKNKTKNYSFEVAINDFANSWYFDVPDSNCEYEVELIRKDNYTKELYPIANSNKIEVPNNHILFEQNRKEIFYKNVKTNTVSSKSVVNLHFINHVGNTYPAYTFYNKFYDKKDITQVSNPSSK